MPHVLLRPHVLGFKNRFSKASTQQTYFRDIVLLIIALSFVYGIYSGTYSFLLALSKHPSYELVLPSRLLHVFILGFFLLLLFSNTVAALGFFYISKDLHLLLHTPISTFRLFSTRIIETLCTSSWMFVLFGLPALLAFYHAFELPSSFLLTALFVFSCLILLPTLIGATIVTVFVNLIPPHRMRDILVIFAFACVCLLLFFGQDTSPALSTEQEQLGELISYLSQSKSSQASWSPSYWAAEALGSYLLPQASSTFIMHLGLLAVSVIVLYSISYLLFRSLFLRGWTISTACHQNSKRRFSTLGNTFGRILIPFHPQFRALVYKEAKTFIRDTTQSLQLLLLLTLTFIYIYNFRALRMTSQLSPESLSWWQVVLCLANISFGSCVIAAIATRFVFPSVSLEGRAYAVLRTTPLSIKKLLWLKLTTWYIPMCIIAITLLVSGALAIQASIYAVYGTAFLACALVFGITGLAIGTGAAYAKFDWDSPAQVTASFGSLVFMLFCLGLVIASMIPATLIFIAFNVESLSKALSSTDYAIFVGGSYLLVWVVNIAVARKAIAAGEEHLQSLER